MNTKGSGVWYSHDNVLIGNVDQRICTGYLDFNRTILHLDDVELVRVKMPVALGTIGNPQRDFYDVVTKDMKIPDTLHPFATKDTHKIIFHTPSLCTRFCYFISPNRDRPKLAKFKLFLSGMEVLTNKRSFWRRLFGDATSDFFWGNYG